ncbi:hypothetical protein CPB84DRAFT_1849016 [Gymnopilus junonius]|uniref:Uncharacterized protein n=1 Tax=Gymnopilus junonius TaxID=109634 RepID=A0A9P5TLG2_GYMJU|nr:hypothetical protein CPB84DRAFT_1849016 [Gymnopilus junonius]
MSMQGTLGFNFSVGKDLYAATVRHVMLRDSEGNEEYKYSTSTPQKEVVVMGPQAFNNYLTSIQSKIGSLNHTLTYLSMRSESLLVATQKNGQKTSADDLKLKDTQFQLTKTRTHIQALKGFFVNAKRDWGNLAARVIGRVDWAPPMALLLPMGTAI